MPKDPNLTNKTFDLTEAFLRTSGSLQKAKCEVNRCECERDNALNALGKWIVPDDAADEETFSIWIGSALLQIKRRSHGSYEAVWRNGKQPEVR